MENSPQIQRAMVLAEQGRHQMAEKELRQHLASNPRDGFGQSLLALSLLEQERRDEAEQTARDAIGLAPDQAFTHYVLARVFTDRGRLEDASAAIEEAIRLDPEDADYHAMRAAIEFTRENWKEALAAADTGLQFDAEHVACNNFRAMALVKLGHKTEAGATIGATLARNPENSMSHANQGWTLLEQGRRQEAMTHFRESLRLDPEQEWAKAGLVEAIKAGNPIYAVFLKYLLWMQKLSPGARWGILIGGYLGMRMLSGVSYSNPELAPFILPLRIVYISFALLTWLAYPVFNLMLFLHPFGKHALDREQRSQAGLVGTLLLLALGSLSLVLIPGFSGPALLAALSFGLLAIPVASIYMCSEGWPRWTMIAITLVLAFAGLFPIVIEGLLRPPKGSSLHGTANSLYGFFLVGWFLSQWVANYLAGQRPTR